MNDYDICDLAMRAINHLKAREQRLVTVESCTGGLISATLTDVAGSSDALEGGFVTYSNALKTSAVDVPPALIETFGAVSENVARAMAEGGLAHAEKATLSVAVTGIAGPGGGTPQKPVGTVCFGVATPNTTWTQRKVFAGDRYAVRRQTVVTVLRLLLDHEPM